MVENTINKSIPKPSAFPSEAEVATWESLNREEQVEYMRNLLEEARDSGISSRSVSEIAESALADFKASREETNA